MKAPKNVPRMLAAISASVLAVMTSLGLQSGPAEVAIRDLRGIDDGASVAVCGTVVDMWTTDSGSETFVLVDLHDNSTARAIMGPSSGSGPSDEVSVGDEVRVVGEVSSSQSPPVVYITGQVVSVVRPSQDVLTVKILSEHWALFEGDRLRFRGVLLFDPGAGAFRIGDPDLEHTVVVRWADASISGLIGSDVLVSACLRMDARTMSMVLFADDISPIV